MKFEYLTLDSLHCFYSSTVTTSSRYTQGPTPGRCGTPRVRTLVAFLYLCDDSDLNSGLGGDIWGRTRRVVDRGLHR